MSKVATLVYQDCVFCSVSPRRDWGLAEKKKAEAAGYTFEAVSYLTEKAQAIISENSSTALPYIFVDGKVVQSMDEVVEKPVEKSSKKQSRKAKKTEVDSGE